MVRLDNFLKKNFENKQKELELKERELNKKLDIPNNSVAQALGLDIRASKINPNGELEFDIDTDIEKFNRSQDLRKEFEQKQIVKDFNLIRNQVAAMDGLLKAELNGDIDSRIALDQALITTFNKVTDPNSVVRESEFARTALGAPFISRFEEALNKFKKGGVAITNEDRAALVQGAKIIANERGKIFNEEIDRFSKLAKKGNLDPIDIVGEFKHTDFDTIPPEFAEENPIFRIGDIVTGDDGKNYRVVALTNDPSNPEVREIK